MLSPMFIRRPLAAAVALGAMLLSACGSSSTTNTNPTGSIALTLSPATASIMQGGSTQLSGTLTRSGGFTGAVTITVSGVPTGVTPGGSSSIDATGTTATVTLAVGAGVAPGSYPITVTAHATGLTDATAQFTLVVVASTPASVALTLGSPSISVAQGSHGSSTITLARTAFPGNVTFSANNVPTGATATFTPTATTDNAGQISIDVPAAVATGTYTILVRATGSGITDATAPLTLTVTPEPRALSLFSGGTQIAETGAQLTNPVIARVVRQSDGTGVAGVTVSFTVSAGGGSVGTASAVTDADGKASSTWTLGTVAGATQTLTIASAGLTSVTASATATAEVRVLAIASGSGQTGDAGVALAQPIVAKVTRQRDGSAVTGVPVTFAVTAGGGSVNTATVSTGTDGKASVTWTLGAIGAQTLTASSPGLTTVTATATATAPGLSGIVALGLGDEHACGINAAGNAFCWGYADYGQLGEPVTSYSATPLKVLGSHSFASITGGLYGTCARTSTGSPFCWGEGTYGEIGNGQTANQSSPAAVSFSGGFSQLVAAAYYRCGLSTAGEAWCWGDNTYDQLGNPGFGQQNVPVRVSGGHTFTQLAAGADASTTCGLTSAGAAWCWGWGAEGELGNGTNTTQTGTPVQVAGGNVFTMLVGGAEHFCGRMASGGWKCWGYNGYGMLGDGTEVSRNTPVTLQTAGQVFVQLALGYYHSCGRTAAGAVYCWGDNFEGELGNGNRDDSDTPVAAAAGLSFTDIQAGDEFTCGLSSGGSVYCWGSNDEGQLGDNVVNRSTTPLRVPAAGQASLRKALRRP